MSDNESFQTAECRSFSSGGKGALDDDDEVRSHACTEQSPSLQTTEPLHIPIFKGINPSQRPEKRPASLHDIHESTYRKIALTSPSARRPAPGEIAHPSSLIAASQNDVFPPQRHATKTQSVQTAQSHLSILQGAKNVEARNLQLDGQPKCLGRLKEAGTHQHQEEQLQESHGSLKLPSADAHQENPNEANKALPRTVGASSGNKLISHSSLDLNKPAPLYNTEQRKPAPRFQHQTAQFPYGAQQPIATCPDNALKFPGQRGFYGPRVPLNILHQQRLAYQNMQHQMLSSNQNMPHQGSSGKPVPSMAGKLHAFGGQHPKKWDPYTCTWISETKPTIVPPLHRSPALAGGPMAPMPVDLSQCSANIHPQNGTRASPVIFSQSGMYAASKREWAVHQLPNGLFHAVRQSPARRSEEATKHASAVIVSQKDTCQDITKSASAVIQSQKDMCKDGAKPVGQLEGFGNGGSSARNQERESRNDCVDEDGAEEDDEVSSEGDDQGEPEEEGDDDDGVDEDEEEEKGDEGEDSEERNCDEVVKDLFDGEKKALQEPRKEEAAASL